MQRLMSIPADYYVRTFYMNRVVDLPPLVAQAAYDAHAHAPGGEWLLDQLYTSLGQHGLHGAENVHVPALVRINNEACPRRSRAQERGS